MTTAIADTQTKLTAAGGAEPTVPPAVRHLFQMLNDEGIRYCHWKSNLRLPASLDGRTDLDLLVDPAQRQAFRSILHRVAVIPLLAPRGRRYPALEDYLGFDLASGRQFHLHVHYQLVLGEQFVKNYRLPLEEAFLDNTKLYHGVSVPAPELELIVLSLRALLKYRDRDVVKDVFAIRSPGIPAHIRDEIDWLLAQTTLESVDRVLDELGERVPGAVVRAFLETMINRPRDGRALHRLRQAARRALRPFRRHNRLAATLTYGHELWRRRGRFRRSGPVPQMTLPQGGMTLALVGVDGAGKTTLTEAVTTWLGWKVDVHPYYLGSKEPSWLSDGSYILFRAARRSGRSLARRLGEGHVLVRGVASVRDSLLDSHYLFTGYDRYRRYRAGRRLADAGSVVVYDRYPLVAPLDGPQIEPSTNGRLDGRTPLLARLEQRLYDRMEPPDLLLVLEVDPAVSLQRKPDHQWETLVKKRAALDQVTGEMAARGAALVRVDAGRPLADVLGRIQTIIWERLGESDDR